MEEVSQDLPNVPQRVHGRPQQEARFLAQSPNALPNIAKSDFFLCGATMLLADSARALGLSFCQLLLHSAVQGFRR